MFCISVGHNCDSAVSSQLKQQVVFANSYQIKNPLSPREHRFFKIQFQKRGRKQQIFSTFDFLCPFFLKNGLKNPWVPIVQGFPNFSGSAHVTTQTNFGAQVTTLFEKVTTFYLMIIFKKSKVTIFFKIAPPH